MRYAIGLRDDDVFFGGADPGWAYGLIFCTFAPMAFGVPIVFYEGPFKPETCYSLMEKYRVTNFAYAPTAYRAMAAAGAHHGLTGRTLFTKPSLTGAEVTVDDD